MLCPPFFWDLSKSFAGPTSLQIAHKGLLHKALERTLAPAKGRNPTMMSSPHGPYGLGYTHATMAQIGSLCHTYTGIECSFKLNHL